LTVGLLNFSTTPTDKIVTKGAYGISRNPSYVSDVLLMIGIGAACLSWVFLLAAIIDFFLLRKIVFAEEHVLLKKYGDVYREYMNRTPRWLGIPKSQEKR
jgi:protein-S-isoprenylcysteine O-methyltransferase Ste14